MLYRLIVNFLQPFTLLILVLILVLVVLWRRRAASRRDLLFLLVPLVLLYLFCMPLIAYPMLGLLEWSYPPIYERPAEAEAIVVLGSGVSPPDRVRKKAVLDGAGILRCMKAAELYHAGEPCLIVVTGGRANPRAKGPVMAVVMRDFLLQVGVKPEDVIVESRSLSTYENAVFAGEYLRDRGIDSVLVVSDASHLVRAVRCFKKRSSGKKGGKRKKKQKSKKS